MVYPSLSIVLWAKTASNTDLYTVKDSFGLSFIYTHTYVSLPSIQSLPNVLMLHLSSSLTNHLGTEMSSWMLLFEVAASFTDSEAELSCCSNVKTLVCLSLTQSIHALIAHVLTSSSRFAWPPPCFMFPCPHLDQLPWSWVSSRCGGWRSNGPHSVDLDQFEVIFLGHIIRLGLVKATTLSIQIQWILGWVWEMWLKCNKSKELIEISIAS